MRVVEMIESAFLRDTHWYVDGTGNAHFLYRDWQGNVVLTVDADNNVEQMVGYYPYGEPWREPWGQRQTLFAGKKRQQGQLSGDWDFGPRHLSSPSMLWSAPDVNAVDNPWWSPWAYCGGNPVRYVDPNGQDIVILNYGDDMTHQHLAILIQDEDKKWYYYSVNGNNVYLSGEHRGGRRFNDIAIGPWDSPQDFMDSSYNQRTEESKDDRSFNNYVFNEGFLIPTTSEQDMEIRETFEHISLKEYHILGNNCATAVQRALIKAGIEVAYPKYETIRVPANHSIGEDGHELVKHRINHLPSKAFHSIRKLNPKGKMIYKIQL